MPNPEKHAERVVEDFRRVPETANENAPVDIKIAGRVYPFAEPVAMKAQVLRGQGFRLWDSLGLMRIFAHQEKKKADGADGSENLEDMPLDAMADLYEGLPRLLAFVGKALMLDANQQKRIEDIVSDSVITDLVAAHSVIMEVLNRPTNGGPPVTDPEDPATATLTNGKPETP